MLIQAPLRDGFGLGPVLGPALALLSSVGLWLVVPAPVAGRTDRPARRAARALLAGIGTATLSRAAQAVMPTAMDRSLSGFGALGPVFTFLSWLIAVFLVAVAGLALYSAIAAGAWYEAVTTPPYGRGPRR
ncbi:MULTISPECIES: hypothetical protein [unclassified Streptomyces]|uniref:hypothetical protein n=1 Tax=unclassified Streptomyces TaxID=2593676 RepID=UPI0032557AE0